MSHFTEFHVLKRDDVNNYKIQKALVFFLGLIY